MREARTKMSVVLNPCNTHTLYVRVYLWHFYNERRCSQLLTYVTIGMCALSLRSHTTSLQLFSSFGNMSSGPPIKRLRRTCMIAVLTTVGGRHKYCILCTALCYKVSGVTRGRTAPGDTLQTTWEDGSGEETTAKRVITLQRRWLKTVVKKNRVTPSVAAPGDTNPSDTL